jgi:hypothetical protein
MFIDISWRDGYVNGFHEAESWQISDSQSLSKFQVPTSKFQLPRIQVIQLESSKMISENKLGRYLKN